MTDPVVLGVDIGSSRIKVAAYVRSGDCYRSAAVPTPRRVVGGVIDLPVLAMIDAVRQALVELDVPPVLVAAAGVATMGEVGTVLRDGALVDLAFPAWFDERGSEIVGDLVDRFGIARLAGATGREPRATTSVAKLGWLRRQGVDLSGQFLGLGAALVWRLTGVARQERSLAATSGAFDVVRGRYDEAIWLGAGLAGLRPAPCAESDTEPARTLAEAVAGWPLPADVPVVLAGHDHPVAAVGAGAVPGEVIDSMGTGEPLVAAWAGPSDPSPDRIAALVQSGLTVTSWPSTGDLAVLWEAVRPGLAMDRLAHTLGGDQVDRAALDRDCPPPGAVAPLADETVLALEDGHGVTIAPTLQSWAALMDHYALRVARGERLLRSVTGAAGPLVLTGGGTRSPRWLAAKQWAHRNGPGRTEPLELSSATETVARGAAALAGAHLTWWPVAADMPGVSRRSLR